MISASQIQQTMRPSGMIAPQITHLLSQAMYADICTIGILSQNPFHGETDQSYLAEGRLTRPSLCHSLYVCRYHIYEFCAAWGVGEHPARNLAERVPVSMCPAGADQRAQGVFHLVWFYTEVLCRFGI